MTPDRLAPQSFSWGESYAYQTDIRERVLAERITWFIQIRWGVAALCGLATAAALFGLVPGRLDWRYFAAVGAFLAVANGLLSWGVGHHLRNHRLMVAQLLVDYVALSVLTYATGSIEMPVFVLYVAHVFLSCLFFAPRVSLAMTGLGFAFAVLPMVLESLGVVPVVSVIDLGLKAGLTADPRFLPLYAAALAGCYLFLWYLTAVITSRLKLREKQLEESHTMLERLDQEKTDSTLRATHELKAPFAAIKSYVYSLRDGYCGDLPPKAREVVGRIGDRCDRLTSMITAIIHVSNLRTTVMSQADFEAVDLGQLLAPEVEEAAVHGAPRRVAVKGIVPDGEPLLVRASPRHLHTLISNLLRNAVTYSREGGEVAVSLHPARTKVVLRVLDHGIGIARENIPKIFDDFFRSNEAARVNPHGNGLGLAMVKEVAKLHGATIEVASEPGKGTCFWVWFPRVKGGDNGKGADHR